MMQGKRKSSKWKVAMILFEMLLCCMSACSLDKLYYADKPDPIRAITETFGTPLWVEGQSDGSEKLIYLVRDPMGPDCYRRYFIVKDGKVMGGGIE